jgi:hypothetical protein
MACEVAGEKDTRELLLASISQADRLTSLINDSLSSVTSSLPGTPADAEKAQPQPPMEDEESLRIVEEGDVEEPPPPALPQQSSPKTSTSSTQGEVMVTLSAQQLLRISTKLNEQLAQLLVRVGSCGVGNFS